MVLNTHGLANYTLSQKNSVKANAVLVLRIWRKRLKKESFSPHKEEVKQAVTPN